MPGERVCRQGSWEEFRLEIGGGVAYIRFDEPHEDRRLLPVRQARA
jgi:hypothetical protein